MAAEDQLGTTADRREVRCPCDQVSPYYTTCGKIIKQREKDKTNPPRCSGCKKPWLQIADGQGICVYFRTPAARKRFGYPPLETNIPEPPDTKSGKSKSSGKKGKPKGAGGKIDQRLKAAPSPFSNVTLGMGGGWYQGAGGKSMWANPIVSPFLTPHTPTPPITGNTNTTNNSKPKNKGGKKGQTSNVDNRDPTPLDRIMTAIRSQFKGLPEETSISDELGKDLLGLLSKNGVEVNPRPKVQESKHTLDSLASLRSHVESLVQTTAKQLARAEMNVAKKQQELDNYSKQIVGIDKQLAEVIATNPNLVKKAEVSQPASEPKSGVFNAYESTITAFQQIKVDDLPVDQQVQAKQRIERVKQLQNDLNATNLQFLQEFQMQQAWLNELSKEAPPKAPSGDTVNPQPDAGLPKANPEIISAPQAAKPTDTNTGEAQAPKVNPTGGASGAGAAASTDEAARAPTTPQAPIPALGDVTMKTELGGGIGGGVKRSEDGGTIGSDDEATDSKRTKKDSDSDTHTLAPGGKKRQKKKTLNPSSPAVDLKRQQELEAKTKSLIEAAAQKAKDESSQPSTGSASQA